MGTVVSPTSRKILSGIWWRFFIGLEHIVWIIYPWRWGWRLTSSALNKRGDHLLSINHMTRKLLRLTKEYNARALPTFVRWRYLTTSFISGVLLLLGVQQCGTQDTILPSLLILSDRWTPILVICCCSRTGVIKLNIICIHLTFSTLWPSLRLISTNSFLNYGNQCILRISPRRCLYFIHMTACGLPVVWWTWKITSVWIWRRWLRCRFAYVLL